MKVLESDGLWATDRVNMENNSEEKLKIQDYRTQDAWTWHFISSRYLHAPRTQRKKSRRKN